MNELLKKIYEKVISQEEDIFQMDKHINDCMEEYISRYKEDFSEKDMERIRDCVYYAVLTSQIEAFQMGMKYTVKTLLSILADL